MTTYYPQSYIEEQWLAINEEKQAMTARKLRPVLAIVSDIGALGFDLQHHSDEQIAYAVAVLRTVNPEMFRWLSRALAEPASSPCGTESTDQPASVTAREETSVLLGAAGGVSRPPRQLIDRLEDAARAHQANAECGSITSSVGEELFTALLLEQAAKALRGSLVSDPPAPHWATGIDVLISVNAALHAVDAPWRIDVKEGQAIAVPTPEVYSAAASDPPAWQPAVLAWLKRWSGTLPLGAEGELHIIASLPAPHGQAPTQDSK